MRNRQGKSDHVDAIAAARAALSGTATGLAKGRDGNVEAIRVLGVARRCAVDERIQILNQMRHICFCASDEIRTRFEDLSPKALLNARDGGGGDAVPEATHLAVDTAVAPCGVLGIEAQYESAQFGRSWWPPGSYLRRLGPVAGDEASMPADHGGGLDDQHHPDQASPIEATRQHSEDHTICGCEFGPLELSFRTKIWWRNARISASRLSPLTNSSPTRVIRSRNRCERTEDTAGQSTGRAPSDLLRRVPGTLRLTRQFAVFYRPDEGEGEGTRATRAFVA